MSRGTKRDNSAKSDVLYMAMELSKRTWKLGFSKGGRKQRIVNVAAGNLQALQDEVKKAKRKLRLDKEVTVRSCYEAGRDGFWLHRYLLSYGIENVVVDSSSIEVDRRKRRAKTDRIDANKLLNMLMRYHWSERLSWRVVRVPSVEEEDGRHLHRELEVLRKERTMHRNRMKGLFIQHGIAVKNPSSKRFLEELESLRSWDGKSLPLDFKARIVREYERLKEVEVQVYTLRKERQRRLEENESLATKKVTQLMSLHGISVQSSWKFVMEFFGWRQFKNRKEVGSLAGLTPTPYDSGGSQREQGISKAGNKRIRTLAVEMAWVWLRF